MNEKIENVSGFGMYTVVKLTPLDEDGNEINGSIQYAVMAGGALCYSPVSDIKVVMKWAKERKDDLFPIVEEVKMENEAEAKANDEAGDTSLSRPGGGNTN